MWRQTAFGSNSKLRAERLLSRFEAKMWQIDHIFLNLDHF